LLRSACEIIKEKHADVPRELHQLLFLQMFSSFYRVKPTLADWKQFFEWRARPKIMARMMRAAVRNMLIRFIDKNVIAA
jgi:hypothetical protein